MTRPISNLRANKDFALPAGKLKAGFIAAWRGMPSGKKGRSGISPTAFYTTLIFNLLAPGTARAEIKNPLVRVEDLKDESGTRVVSSVLTRNLSNKSFEFRVPFVTMAGADNGKWNGLKIWEAYDTENLTDAHAREYFDLLDPKKDAFDGTFFSFSGPEAASRVNLDEACKALLRTSVKTIEFEIRAGLLYGHITWIITKEEVEYLNNAQFLEVKMATFYPVLLDWAAGVMGQMSRVPATVTAISKIVQQVDKSQELVKARPRVGIDGLVIDIHKRLFAFPNVDNSLQYEQLLTNFGMQEDGSYVWRPESTGPQDEFTLDGAPKKLPVNIPVFTDWVNDKFAYSNTAGKLAVFDLGNTVPARNVHIRSVLDAWASPADNTGAFDVLGTAVAIATSFDKSVLTESAFDDIDPENTIDLTDAQKAQMFPPSTSSLAQLVRVAVLAHKRLNPYETDLYVVGSDPTAKIFDLNPKTGILTFRFIGRILHSALKAIESNKEAALQRYSVLAVYQALATLKVFVKYASNMSDVISADEKERASYLDQNLDPAYEVEPLPNIQPKLKYLPHQFRVQNRMRRGPAFAVWAVAAGGGKSILTLTNILNELKEGRCKRPIITCPSHLVSNYVKEVVYVTEGKLNLITVTNQVLKQHGYEYLEKLIANAPINSVVITDFNFLKGGEQEVSYGNKTIKVYQNAEFMRQFEFDLIVVDEVHKLKNLESALRKASSRFMQDIPMKRIASGTLIADTMTDLVAQIALLDPSIFGSMATFIDTYALSAKGGKVIAWKENAERDVRLKIEEHVVFAAAKRKEWAAALPKSTERFISVELTQQQRLLYESVLNETSEMIREAAAKDPKLKAMLDNEDESQEGSLEAKLRPYLARLERFLSNPDSDPLASQFLKDPGDSVSPKALKIYDIIRDHLAGVTGKNKEGEKIHTEDGLPIPGKILIFTQYKLSAEHVYENAPADLKPLFIHYTAAEKEECRVAFEKDPRKIVMIGVSSSMDTGLNFQHVSRLIRMETVWTPGALEQGNSRINRPELKNVEMRKQIYFDWLAINRTVDITKVARLISKVISAAKFDEHDNPNYQEIIDLPKVAMKLESIQANNDFQAELMPYLEAFRDYQAVRDEDYADYKRDNPDSLTAVAVPLSGNLKGSKLIARLPYVTDMAIYNAEQLGAIRYDEFMQQDAMSLDEDEDGGTEDEDSEELDENDAKNLLKEQQKAKFAEERKLMKDRPAHTEFGDGVITQVNRTNVKVTLADGTVKRLNKMKIYVITRSTTNSIDMRNEMLKQVGDIPLDTPITVPAKTGAADKKRLLKAKGVKVDKTPVKEDTQIHVSLDLNVINDYLALVYATDDPSSDSSNISALQNFGFDISPEYMFCRVLNAKRLLELMRAFRDKGFTLSPEQSANLKEVWSALTANRKALNNFGFATQMDIRLFHRERLKPSANEKILKLYPIVQDGRLYIALPLKGIASTRKAIRVKPPGVVWMKGGGSSEIAKFVRTKGEVTKALREMRDAGVVIDNLDAIKKQFQGIRMKGGGK